MQTFTRKYICPDKDFRRTPKYLTHCVGRFNASKFGKHRRGTVILTSSRGERLAETTDFLITVDFQIGRPRYMHITDTKSGIKKAFAVFSMYDFARWERRCKRV